MKWPAEALYENPKLLFPFYAIIFLSLMNVLAFVDIDQGIY